MNGVPQEICTVVNPAFSTFCTAVDPKVKMLSYSPLPSVPVLYVTVPKDDPAGAFVLTYA